MDVVYVGTPGEAALILLAIGYFVWQAHAYRRWKRAIERLAGAA